MDEEPADVGAPAPSVGRRFDREAVQGELGRAEAEFSDFYRAYMPRLVRFLIFDGAPPALAADLAQEVMIELWRRWGAIQSPKAWSRTAASRAWIRYRTTLPEQPMDVLPEPGALLNASDAEAVLARHDLLRLLESLTPRQRQVMARIYDGDTHAEIAAELGIEEATVRSITRAARTRIAAQRQHHEHRREV